MPKIYNFLAQQRNGWDNLRNPHYPVVPEPSTYGVFFVGICVSMALWKKYINKN